MWEPECDTFYPLCGLLPAGYLLLGVNPAPFTLGTTHSRGSVNAEVPLGAWTLEVSVGRVAWGTGEEDWAFGSIEDGGKVSHLLSAQGGVERPGWEGASRS